MSLQWRVEWQCVNRSVNPQFFDQQGKPVVVASEVPDMYWTTYHREGREDDIVAQWRALSVGASEHLLLRNITLWNAPAVIQVTWQRAE